MARCPGNMRHWFSIQGQAYLRSPVCVRCGEPNPRPLTDDDWSALEDFNTHHGPLYAPIVAALRERDMA